MDMSWTPIDMVDGKCQGCHQIYRWQ